MDDHPRIIRKPLVILSISTLLFLTISLWLGHLIAQNSPKGLIDLALAKELDVVSNILLSWGEEGKTWATYSLFCDFPLLFSYTLLFSQLTRWTKNNAKHLFTIGFLMAGMCGAIGNVALILQIKGLVLPQLAAGAFYFTSLKLMLLISGVLYLVSQLALVLWTKAKSQASNQAVTSQPWLQ